MQAKKEKILHALRSGISSFMRLVSREDTLLWTKSTFVISHETGLIRIPDAIAAQSMRFQNKEDESEDVYIMRDLECFDSVFWEYYRDERVCWEYIFIII